MGNYKRRYESSKTKYTGRIESPDCELLQRLLRPNGMRVYSRYGDDGGGSYGVDGSNETSEIILFLNIFSTSLHFYS